MGTLIITLIIICLATQIIKNGLDIYSYYKDTGANIRDIEKFKHAANQSLGIKEKCKEPFKNHLDNIKDT